MERPSDPSKQSRITFAFHSCRVYPLGRLVSNWNRVPYRYDCKCLCVWQPACVFSCQLLEDVVDMFQQIRSNCGNVATNTRNTHVVNFNLELRGSPSSLWVAGWIFRDSTLAWCSHRDVSVQGTCLGTFLSCWLLILGETEGVLKGEGAAQRGMHRIAVDKQNLPEHWDLRTPWHPVIHFILTF